MGIVSNARPSGTDFVVPAMVFRSTLPAPFSTCALRNDLSSESSRQDASYPKRPAFTEREPFGIMRLAASFSGLPILVGTADPRAMRHANALQALRREIRSRRSGGDTALR